MPELTILVAYTINSGDDPATGLALADIDLYLTAVHVTTGARTVIWDGTQNPIFEVNNCGVYGRIYADGDLDTYNYVGGGNYTGAVALDNDWVVGSVSKEPSIFPAGAINFTYTLTDSLTGLPIPGAEVWITTDIAGTNIIWKGSTDTFGVARDVENNLPALNAGTYYFWRKRASYTFDDPDTEIVS